MRCIVCRVASFGVIGSVSFAAFLALSSAVVAFDGRAGSGFQVNRGSFGKGARINAQPLSRNQITRVRSEARVRDSVRRADIAFAWPPYSSAEKRAILRGYPMRTSGGWSRGGWSGAGIGGVTPIVLPSTVETTPLTSSSVTGMRSIVDIPATTGIRAAPVGEPVLYRIETRGRTATMTPSSGPRIITLGDASTSVRTLGDGAGGTTSPQIIQVRPN